MAVSAYGQGTEPLTPTTPCGSARTALATAAASRGWDVDVGCGGREASVAAPEGAVWIARLPASLTAGSSRLAVDAVAGDRVLQTVAVAVQLRLTSRAWVVTHPVREGARLADADVALQRIEWPAGAVPFVPREKPPEGRAHRPLRTGQPLAPSDLLAEDQRLQGDPVTVLSRGPGLEIRVAATLTQAARPGELASAQINGQREVVRGRLVEGNTLLVEP